MAEALQSAVRDITNEEVDKYRRDGWVKLPGLVAPDFIARVLEAAKRMYSEIESDPALKDSGSDERRISRPQYDALLYPGLFTFRNLACEPFDTLSISSGLGRAAHRLIDRKRLGADRVGTRLLDASLLCKLPQGVQGSGESTYHQEDANNLGIDRTGMVSFWIALDHVTPDQGTVSFFEGSHRLGCLGNHRPDLLDDYPAIRSLCPETTPFAFAPGDATAHHPHTIHGAAGNNTDRARWAFVAAYIPDDCTVAENASTPMGRHAPYERFPMVYAPERAFA